MLKNFLRLLAVPFFVLVNLQVNAQSPAIQWNKVFGTSRVNDAFCTQQTRDGGYIVAGQSGNYGLDQFIVIKLARNGGTQWEKFYGGTASESANSIQQTTDGGYIVAGESNSTTGVNGNHGGFDMWIIKLDSNGNMKWQRSFGGSKDDFAFSIQQTTDGGYIVGGGANSNDGNVHGNHGGEDVWVVKLDDGGKMMWQKTYGGSNNEFVNSIRQTKDGGYIAAGNTTSNDGQVTGVHDMVYGDFWIIRIDKSGNLLWQKALGGSDYDQANTVMQTTDGGYFAAGWSRSSNGNVTGAHGNYDFWVVKLDSNHNLKWEKTYGGSNGDLAYTAQQTPDGGYILGGGSVSTDEQVVGIHGAEDFWIVKIDADGNLQWQSPYGGSFYEEARSIDQASDGGYIVAGFTNSTDGQVTANSSGNYVCWVMKLNGCNCIPPIKGFSVKNITSSSATVHWDTISCAEGYVVQYRKQGDISWKSVLVTGNMPNRMLKNLSSVTTYQWEVAQQCPVSPNSVFSTIQTFTTSAGTLTSHPDMFAQPILGSFRVTPDPAVNQLNISYEGLSGNAQLRLYTMTGALVMQKNISGNGTTYNEQLDISRLPAGLYCITVKTTDSFASLKFIKE